MATRRWSQPTRQGARIDVRQRAPRPERRTAFARIATVHSFLVKHGVSPNAMDFRPSPRERGDGQGGGGEIAIYLQR